MAWMRQVLWRFWKLVWPRHAVVSDLSELVQHFAGESCSVWICHALDLHERIFLRRLSEQRWSCSFHVDHVAKIEGYPDEGS